MRRWISVILIIAVLLSFAVPNINAASDYDVLAYCNFENSENSFVANNADMSIDSETDADNYAYGSTMYYKSNEGSYGNVRMQLPETISWAATASTALGANAYIQLSFDIKLNTNTNGRVIYVKLPSSSGSNNIGIALYPGSKSFKYGNDCTEKTVTLSTATPKDEWINFRAVMQLTDADSAAAYKMKQIYMDGVQMIAEGEESTSYKYSSIGYIALSAQNTNVAWANIDNISLVKYNAADGICPAPDRYGFRNSIDKYIAAYNEYIAAGKTEEQLAAAAAKIAEAKTMYNSASLTTEQCTAVCAEIEAELSKIDPSPEDYKHSFDFETEENKTEFNSITNYTLTEKTDADTYGIGTHYAYSYNSNKMYFDFAAPLDRTSPKMENAYLEVEFDMRTAADNIKNAGLVILGPYGVDADGKAFTKYIGGIQYEEKTGDIHAWWRTSKDPVAKWTVGEWQRFKIVTKLNENGTPVKTESTDIYVNGVKCGTYDDYSGTADEPIEQIYGFHFPNGNGTLHFDNIKTTVYTSENKPAEKGVLVAKMRAFYNAYKTDYKYYEDVRAAFEAAEAVYISEAATQTQVDAALVELENAETAMEKYLEQLRLLGTEIVIPSTGEDSSEVTIPFMLHYGEPEGDDNFNDLFFNKACSPDFSDVKFVDRFGNEIPSQIVSGGNYDFIRDSKLGGNNSILHLSDGTLVTNMSGYVAFSKDNAQNWDMTAHRGTPGFVDRNDNIYYNVSKVRDDGQKVGIYKLSADDNYTEAKLVIDCTAAIEGTEDRTMDKPSYLVDSAEEVTFDMSNMAQDDDGYLYFGRYHTEWIGVKLYVSDETGENFKCVDWRLDKQHNHAVRINRLVYPNEVYVTYDDTKHSPLCQVTTTHAGYDLIKDDPNYDDTKYEQVRALAEQSFTQVPIPYQNSDYFGYFGIIDNSEDKFYTAQNGKRYTKEDNVYGIGMGEANILGGPSLYKTTDKWDQSKYYPLVETTHGIRNVVSPVDGILVAGFLSGNYAQTQQLAISYDEGETWTTALNEGLQYSSGAGNGAMRFFTDYFTPMGADEAQMISSGYESYAIRSKFGGDNYFAMCYVKLDELSAAGDKIFVTIDSDKAAEVFEYAVKDIDYTDADGNVSDVTPQTGELSGVVLERFGYIGENSMLIAAEYDESGRLTQVKTTSVSDNGRYDVNLPLTADGGNHKLFMLEEMQEIKPITMKAYDSNKKPDWFVNNNLINEPIVRLKLDEGVGNTVTESISGRTLTIDGDYEWIDTQIRYGNSMPVQARSNSALRLDTAASINIGELEALQNLDFTKDSITIAFWTNTEVYSQREGYEETDPYHLSDTYGNIRCGNKFSNQDYHVILHNDTFDFTMKYNSVHFIGDGIDHEDIRVPQPLLDTNYYNLYFVTIKGGETISVQTYGNDGRSSVANTELVLDDGTALDFAGNLYLGTPGGVSASGGTYSKISSLGLADVMIFDRELTYAERLALYHGINQYGALGIE